MRKIRIIVSEYLGEYGEWNEAKESKVLSQIKENDEEFSEEDLDYIFNTALVNWKLK